MVFARSVDVDGEIVFAFHLDDQANGKLTATLRTTICFSCGQRGLRAESGPSSNVSHHDRSGER